MTKYTLVVAALLLTGFVNGAAAAEKPEHKTKNAGVLVLLNSMGMNDKQVLDFVDEIDTRIDHGYFNLTQQKLPGGQLTLRYHFSRGVSMKQVELRFAPENSRFDCIASTQGIMVNYRLKF